MNLRNFAFSFMAAILLTGCSTTITNLTPSQQPRNPNNIYPFEVTLETTQQSIRQDTIQPSVIIGTSIYPMNPTPMLTNRWEALVPVPANTNYVYYRYKFDYLYDRMPQPGHSSRLSQTYQLEIVDR
jgi:hypothetical protein